MTKQHLILQIRQAYISHIKWRSTAKAIHMGLPIIEKEVAQSISECDFGKWFYGEGKILSDFELYHTIDKLHQKIHHIYQSIYKLDISQKDIMTKLHLKLDDECVEKRQIAAYFKDMAKLSKEFLQALKNLEVEILKLPDDFFSKTIS
jgi:hypothetical protein